MPLLVGGAGIDREHGVGLELADHAAHLLGELTAIDVLEHAVVVSEPLDVGGGDAEDAAGLFLFRLADRRQALVRHRGVARAGVVGGVDEDVDAVLRRQHRERAAGGEGVVVGVGSDDQDRLSLPLLDAIAAGVLGLGDRDLRDRRGRQGRAQRQAGETTDHANCLVNDSAALARLSTRLRMPSVSASLPITPLRKRASTPSAMAASRQYWNAR